VIFTFHGESKCQFTFHGESKSLITYHENTPYPPLMIWRVGTGGAVLRCTWGAGDGVQGGGQRCARGGGERCVRGREVGSLFHEQSNRLITHHVKCDFHVSRRK
jgi:hypothetical protein